MSNDKKVNTISNSSTSFREININDTNNNYKESHNINVYFGNNEKKALYHREFPNNAIKTTKYWVF